MTDEKRVTSDTGGQKGQKTARFDLIDSGFLWELSRVCGLGAQKYTDDNWRNGYDWGLSYGALQRHLHQFLMGEDLDDELKTHHMANVAWHAMVLYVFSTSPRYRRFDTRRWPKNLVPECIGPGPPKMPWVPYDPEPPKGFREIREELDSILAVANATAAIDVTPPPEAAHASTDAPPADAPPGVRFEKTELINGHSVQWKNQYTGYVDGQLLNGMEFWSKVDLLRKGFDTPDDMVAAIKKGQVCGTS